MKRYIATYTVKDGNHTYIQAITFFARSEDKAWMRAETEQHTVDDDHGCFNFGDHLTEATLRSVREITEEQARMLAEIGIAPAF